MQRTTIKEKFIFTVFGASGDLAKLKIFPAIYELALQRRLPKEFLIYGFSRKKMSTEEFQFEFKNSILTHCNEVINEKLLNELLEKVYYFQGEYNDEKSFSKFFKTLEKHNFESSTKLLAYYSTPPFTFNDITINLGKHKSDFQIKLILEKPFGENEKSAREMFAIIQERFNEKDVFLLDHYLGKESVQSITSMRYANSIINHLLKGNLIENIQISALETVGIKERGKYFDSVGMLKDMIQSHLLQLLALVTMSMPRTLNAESIHREKYNILSALTFDPKNFLVKGVYESYHDEKDIDKKSKTETFIALKTYIDQSRWADIPIFIRTGKKLNRKHTYISIVFKKLDFQKDIPDLTNNELVIEIQPNPNVYFKIINKRGGTFQEFHQIAPSQSLACFGDDCLAEHSRLILDVLQENKMNFLNFNMVIACWKFIDEVIEEANKQNIKIEKYSDGSSGPNSQNNLLKNDQLKWHEI